MMDTFLRILVGFLGVLGMLVFISWNFQLMKKACVEAGRELIAAYFANKLAFLDQMEKKYGEGQANRASREPNRNFN